MSTHDLSVVFGNLIDRAPPEEDIREITDKMLSNHPSRAIEWVLTLVGTAESNPIDEMSQQILTVRDLLGAGCVGVDDDEFKKLVFTSLEMAYPNMFAEVCSSEDSKRWIVETVTMFIGVVRKWSP